MVRGTAQQRRLAARRAEWRRREAAARRARRERENRYRRNIPNWSMRPQRSSMSRPGRGRFQRFGARAVITDRNGRIVNRVRWADQR